MDYSRIVLLLNLKKQNMENYFLSMNANRLPSDRLNELNLTLKNLNENQRLMMNSVDLHNPTTFLLLYLFLPGFCLIDRFFTGNVASGIFKLITLGGLGIWVIVDIFLILGRTKKNNYNKLLKAIEK